MNDTSSKLEVGDFVRNKIHGYTSMLFKDCLHSTSVSINFIGWNALIVDWATNFITVGTIRSELPTELEKVPATSLLITKAKEYLDKLNTYTNIDNLTYVEILYKLNEREKELLKNNITI